MSMFEFGFSGKKLLKIINPTAHFTPKQIRNYIILVISITILFVSIYALIRFHKVEKIKTNIKLTKVFTSEETQDLLERPNIGDFLFPDGLIDKKAPELSLGLFAETETDGSELSDFIAKYWVDPSSIGITDLPERNQKILEEYLEKAAAKDPNF